MPFWTLCNHSLKYVTSRAIRTSEMNLAQTSYSFTMGRLLDEFCIEKNPVDTHLYLHVNLSEENRHKPVFNEDRTKMILPKTGDQVPVEINEGGSSLFTTLTFKLSEIEAEKRVSLSLKILYTVLEFFPEYLVRSPDFADADV